MKGVSQRMVNVRYVRTLRRPEQKGVIEQQNECKNEFSVHLYTQLRDDQPFTGGPS